LGDLLKKAKGIGVRAVGLGYGSRALKKAKVGGSEFIPNEAKQNGGEIVEGKGLRPAVS